eukprot:CAMPEP_0118642300 /NCGR_PEP_ID=MMETSP0785-20121206/5763_1 /TAXON_ID=91992 /ORGANISM="Bolidomonas pacifica, Strain CCMP 1866" /LENGTH=370 /DNA_ID=CAMNT_0006533845 /DNA_START=325 /DNA_END=1434 /DNA_ORIENTATION=+
MTDEELDEIKMDLADLAARHDDIYLPLLEDLFTHIYPISPPPPVPNPTWMSYDKYEPISIPTIMMEMIASFSSYRPDACTPLLPILVGLSWSEDIRISEPASLAVSNITDTNRLEWNKLLKADDSSQGEEKVGEDAARVATKLVCHDYSNHSVFEKLFPNPMKSFTRPYPYFPFNSSEFFHWSPNTFPRLHSYVTFQTTTALTFLLGAIQTRSTLIAKGEQFTKGVLTRPLAARMAAYAGGGVVSAIGAVVWCFLRDYPSKNSYGFKFFDAPTADAAEAKKPLMGGDIGRTMSLLHTYDANAYDRLKKLLKALYHKNILKSQQEPDQGVVSPSRPDIKTEPNAKKILRDAVGVSLFTSVSIFLTLSVAPT